MNRWGFELRHTLVLVAVGVLATACLSPASSSAPITRIVEPVHLKAGMQPFIGYAPLFIAQDNGYFVKHGVEIEFVEIQSSDQIVPLLMQGSLDMSPFAIYPGFFNGVAKGGQARAVFGASRWPATSCVSVALVARPAVSERLQVADNWKGITMGTDPVGVQSMHGFFIDQVLASRGLSLADVKTVKLPPASMIDALRSGAVDVAAVNEPWLTRMAGQSDAVQIAAASVTVPDGQLSVLGFAPRLVQDPDLGRRVALAYLEGLREYQAGNTARNVAILAKYTKLEPELINRMCWPAIPSDGNANLDSIMAFQRWAAVQGLLDRVLSPDEFWDGGFVGLLGHETTSR